MIYILNPLRGGNPKNGGKVATRKKAKRLAPKSIPKRASKPRAKAKVKSSIGTVGSKIKRAKSPTSDLMKKRKSLQTRKRYGSQKRYFRPKLMVDESTGLVYASPLAGGSYKVNPKRKVSEMAKRKKTRKKSRRKYKRNPIALVGRRSTKVSRRRYKRNPALMKQAFNKNHIMSIVSVGVGFVGGIKAQKYINSVSALAQYRKFTGVIPFILGTLVAMKSKKASIKQVGTGLSLSGLYDLVTQNVPAIGLSPVEGVDLDDDMYQGAVVDMDGNVIDLDGEDELVGEEDYVVGDNDSPYMVV